MDDWSAQIFSNFSRWGRGRRQVSAVVQAIQLASKTA
jgi:hypothetical protein